MDAIDKLIAALEADISDRRGLKWEWNKIDADVKKEIREEWRKLIAANLPDAGDTLAHGHVTAVKVGTDPASPYGYVGETTVWFGKHESTFGLTIEQAHRLRDRFFNAKNKPVRAFLVIDTGQGEANDRDAEWREALAKEFKIGGAITEQDDRWVREKATIPERWARVVRLAITPAGVKLHDYPPPPPIHVGPVCTCSYDDSEEMTGHAPLCAITQAAEKKR